jgi:cation/acetate symporter
MIAQMVGAGALVKLLLPGVIFNGAVIGVGILMIIYVVFGGMLATTWVQIIKAILLMGGSILLSIMVMGHFGFSFAAFFEAISRVTYHVKGEEVTRNFLQPGLKFGAAVTNGWGPLDLVSLGLALIFGTAGLPHILVRFIPCRTPRRLVSLWFGRCLSSGSLHYDHSSGSARPQFSLRTGSLLTESQR